MEVRFQQRSNCITIHVLFFFLVFCFSNGVSGRFAAFLKLFDLLVNRIINVNAPWKWLLNSVAKNVNYFVK